MAAAPEVQNIHVNTKLANGAMSISARLYQVGGECAQCYVAGDAGEDAPGSGVPEEDGVDEGEEDGPYRGEEQEVCAVLDTTVRSIMFHGIAGGQPRGDGELPEAENR